MIFFEFVSLFSRGSLLVLVDIFKKVLDTRDARRHFQVPHILVFSKGIVWSSRHSKTMTRCRVCHQCMSIRPYSFGQDGRIRPVVFKPCMVSKININSTTLFYNTLSSFMDREGGYWPRLPIENIASTSPTECSAVSVKDLKLVFTL